MTGVQIVEDIVEILVSGISNMATGIGTGVSNLVTNLALTGTGESQTLSMFTIFVAVFGGISLCVGLGRKILSWIGSLGGRRV